MDNGEVKAGKMEDSDKEEVKRRFEMGEMEAGERFVRELVLRDLSRSGNN